MKIIQIDYCREAYYESSINVSLKEIEQCDFKEYDYYETFNVRNCKEFFKAFKEVVVGEEKHFDISISDMYGLEKLFETCDEKYFNNMYENYKYLEEILTKAYTYNVDLKFNKEVFNNGDGYGEFIQHLIPFSNVELLIKSPNDFKQYCLNRVSQKLRKVFSYGNEDVRKKQLINNISYNEQEIERLQKRLKTLETSLINSKEELDNL